MTRRRAPHIDRSECQICGIGVDATCERCAAIIQLVGPLEAAAIVIGAAALPDLGEIMSAQEEIVATYYRNGPVAVPIPYGAGVEQLESWRNSD